MSSAASTLPRVPGQSKMLLYALKSFQEAATEGQDINGLNVIGFAGQAGLIAAVALKGSLDEQQSNLEKQSAIANSLKTYAENQDQNPTPIGAGTLSIADLESGETALKLEAAGQEQPVLEGVQTAEGKWQISNYALSPEEEEAVLSGLEAEIAGALPSASGSEVDEEVNDDEIEL